ncbi:hypothetical protein V8E36_001798 [Tilletia maclaganii]
MDVQAEASDTDEGQSEELADDETDEYGNLRGFVVSDMRVSADRRSAYSRTVNLPSGAPASQVKAHMKMSGRRGLVDHRMEAIRYFAHFTRRDIDSVIEQLFRSQYYQGDDWNDENIWPEEVKQYVKDKLLVPPSHVKMLLAMYLP